MARRGNKFADLGTTCANTVGYTSVASKPQCQAIAKPPNVDAFYDNMRGKGHDLPKGCVADALSLNTANPIVYWNPEGVATSNDKKIREICAPVGLGGKVLGRTTKYYIIFVFLIIVQRIDKSAQNYYYIHQ